MKWMFWFATLGGCSDWVGRVLSRRGRGACACACGAYHGGVLTQVEERELDVGGKSVPGAGLGVGALGGGLRAVVGRLGRHGGLGHARYVGADADDHAPTRGPQLLLQGGVREHAVGQTSGVATGRSSGVGHAVWWVRAVRRTGGVSGLSSPQARKLVCSPKATSPIATDGDGRAHGQPIDRSAASTIGSSSLSIWRTQRNWGACAQVI